jgi:hypothetical protein
MLNVASSAPLVCVRSRSGLPDTTAPGFAAEAAWQAGLLAEWDTIPAGRDEMAFWDELHRFALTILVSDDASASVRLGLRGCLRPGNE